jgi:hypothetical protein
MSTTSDQRSVNTPELPRIAFVLIYRSLLKGNMPTEVLRQITKDSENNNTYKPISESEVMLPSSKDQQQRATNSQLFYEVTFHLKIGKGFLNLTYS